jgi:hypothetical protein
MRIEAPAGFGSDNNILAPITFQLGQQALAASVAVNISRVKEVDAHIDRAI